MFILIFYIGFCAKFKTLDQLKVFVNVCYSEKVVVNFYNWKVPVARDITDEELRDILNDIENAPTFKIPMSIGEGHVELDTCIFLNIYCEVFIFLCI